jgi:cytochrome bd-type quinol oxidase subunit 1
VWTTIIGFVAIFTVLGGIALWLFLREARSLPGEGGEGPGAEASLAY